MGHYMPRCSCQIKTDICLLSSYYIMISISLAHNYSKPSQSDHLSLVTNLNAVPLIFHTFVTNRSLSLEAPQLSDHQNAVQNLKFTPVEWPPDDQNVLLHKLIFTLC